MDQLNGKLTKVYSGRIIDVFHRKVTLDNKVVEFEIVRRPLVSIVVPVLSSGEMIVTHQYRASVNTLIWEFPGGKVEEKETPLHTAKRELMEETGYQANVFEFLSSFYTCPHFSDEKVYVYLAKDLTPGEPHLQEKESISTHFLSETEFEDKLHSAEMLDAKTMIAYWAFKNKKS